MAVQHVGATPPVVYLPGELQIALRPHGQGDSNYILCSWKKSMRHSASMNWARTGMVYHALNERCNRLFNRLGAIVACNPADESQMLGWVVSDRTSNVLHYVYVRREFRGNSIARALLAGLQEPIACSMWSDAAEWLQRKIRLEYRPSLIE